MFRTPLFLSLSALAAVASCAAPSSPPASTASNPVQPTALTTAAPAAPRTKPKLGSFGVDLAGLDPSTKAGKDFYTFAGGRWMKEQKIPADRSRWGMFDALREEADGNVRTILDEQTKAKREKRTSAEKATDYYETDLDTAA